MSETEITFSETEVYKGVRINKESILDVQTHYNNRNLSITHQA